MRDWKKHIDQTGLLTHNGDGGDTASREGLFAIAEVLNAHTPSRDISWELRRSQLEVAPGTYVRHPESSRAVPSFCSSVAEFSRDQQVPLTMGMIFKQDWWALDRLYKAHRSRFFKCQNSDILGPAIYIRAYRWWWLYPLLWVTDLAHLWNTLNRIGWLPRVQETTGKLEWLNEDDVGDDINHTASLLFARFSYPTLISWVARRLYALRRPHGGVQRAWDHYFREETGAPPLNEIWAPLIARWICG